MKRVLLNEIAGWMGFKCDDDSPINLVQFNSTSVEPGDLFFALPGDNVDGHSFVGDAKARGAKAAVVQRKVDVDLPQIVVDDTLLALKKAAKRRLEIEKPHIFAITGSVGKTTTKDFLTQILKRSFRIASTVGNYNTKITLPQRILNITEDIDWLVLEMGMTRRGDIKNLVEIAPPEMALLTTIAFAHAENFASLDEIAQGKLEIFSHPSTRFAVIEKNFSYRDQINVPWVEAPSFSLVGDQLYLDSKPYATFLLPGAHNAKNLSLAITAARLIGMDDETIKEAIPSLELPSMRLQKVKKEGILFLNDAYNANLTSMMAALDTLGQFPHPNKIAVIGDMLELGDLTEEHHRNLGRYALEKVDTLLCYGQSTLYAHEEWSREKRPSFHFSDKADLVKKLKELAGDEDLILVKGSRGNALWTVIEDF